MFNTLHNLLQEAEEKKPYTGSRKPNIEYTDVYIKKKQPKGAPKLPKGVEPEKVLDRVIANLKKQQAGAFSRLTSRYDRLDRVMKSMIEARDRVNDLMREELEDLFNAEDEIYTRVVETASWTITLSKATISADKKVKDYDKIIEGLIALLDESLIPKAEELVKAHTKIIPGQEVPTKLTVKKASDEAEDLTEGLIKNVKVWLSNMLTKFKAWGRSYDRQLNDLKAQASALGL